MPHRTVANRLLRHHAPRRIPHKLHLVHLAAILGDAAEAVWGDGFEGGERGGGVGTGRVGGDGADVPGAGGGFGCRLVVWVGCGPMALAPSLIVMLATASIHLAAWCQRWRFRARSAMDAGLRQHDGGFEGRGLGVVSLVLAGPLRLPRPSPGSAPPPVGEDLLRGRCSGGGGS
jgi:hypothetical protein